MRELNFKHPDIKAIVKEKEFWILILLGLFFFYRPLFLGETFYYRDLYLHFFPQKKLLVDTVMGGELPLWDPYLHGGQPLLAEPNNIALYPSNLLYFVMPLTLALNIDIVGHLILSCLFAYLFARVLGLPPISSLITGAIYGYCGLTLSLPNVWLVSAPHIPLIFLCWHLYLKDHRARWFVLTVVSGVIQVLAGRPETPPITLLSLLAWSISYPYLQTPISRRAGLWTLLVVFIVAVSSVQILPTAEMILQSSRGQGLTFTDFATCSLNPRRVLELVFPQFLGPTDTLGGFWGKEDKIPPHILSIYFGLAVSALAIAGGLFRNNNFVVPLKARRCLLLIAAVSFIFSFGRFLPLFRDLYEHFPPVRIFRNPIKLLITGILPVALLAGCAVEGHFGRNKTASISTAGFSKILWLISFLLLALIATFVSSPKFATGFQLLFFDKSADHIFTGLRKSFLHTALISFLIALLYQYHQIHKRDWHVQALAAIVIVDLMVAGASINTYTSKDFFLKSRSSVETIRKHIQDGRLYRPETFEAMLKASSNDIFWQHDWNLDVLNSYTAAFYKLPLIFHGDYDGLANLHIRTLKRAVEILPWKDRSRFLSVSGISMVLTEDKLNLPDFAPVARIHNPSNLMFYIYKFEGFQGRTWFVPNAIPVSSGREALRVIRSPDYDPREYVVVEGSGLPRVTHNSESAQVKKTKSRGNSSSYVVENHVDGYLVFSEPYYPGWSVYVDGQNQPLRRANYAFSAVSLPAGKHEVERRYSPGSVWIGTIISLTSILLLLLYARLSSPRRSQSPQSVKK